MHFHVLVPDGVFRADDAGAVVFREGHAPTRADIADVAARVEKRMRRLLGRGRDGPSSPCWSTRAAPTATN